MPVEEDIRLALVGEGLREHRFDAQLSGRKCGEMSKALRQKVAEAGRNPLNSGSREKLSRRRKPLCAKRLNTERET